MVIEIEMLLALAGVKNITGINKCTLKTFNFALFETDN
jgi:hypothetical protein